MKNMTVHKASSSRQLAWALIAALTGVGSAFAEPAVAISGYSPVSYFTQARPELGSTEHAVVYADKTYYLTNAEQVRQFRANPEKYVPRYESCPYSLALGGTMPLDPQNFKIIGGSLLLFHQSERGDGLAQWQASGWSEQELLERADAAVFRVRF